MDDSVREGPAKVMAVKACSLPSFKLSTEALKALREDRN